MPLKDLLKKKAKVENEHVPASPVSPPPEGFTFMRTTTTTNEIIAPPSFGEENDATSSAARQSTPKRTSRFRKSSNASTTSAVSLTPSEKGERRLSQRFHLRGHSRSTSATSIHVPQDLPNIEDAGRDAEAEWEQRATLLAKTSAAPGDPSSSPPQSPPVVGMAGLSIKPGSKNRSRSPSVSDPHGDETIQEAIKLHEAGKLEESTAMFGRLADLSGANNALSQVLYGLALRHGWGCEPNPSQAVTYLSAAAKNSAAVEELALQAGMKSGGAAKGELVLAIYELGNSFRHGWGVAKDPVAAKQYYETAANLGDTDAMNEAAWCYLEGFGTKKDKVRSNETSIGVFPMAVVTVRLHFVAVVYETRFPTMIGAWWGKVGRESWCRSGTNAFQTREPKRNGRNGQCDGA
ncbi:MAG: hypothetical protein M1833_000402 [Piccolia ochrophora]|nr:MAG: hypothetical protein M1833_000402 [Piccolia ochrophora]